MSQKQTLIKVRIVSHGAAQMPSEIPTGWEHRVQHLTSTQILLRKAAHLPFPGHTPNLPVRYCESSQAAGPRQQGSEVQGVRAPTEKELTARADLAYSSKGRDPVPSSLESEGDSYL